MATTIYSVPSEIKQPEFNWEDMKTSKEAEDKFLAELKAWCRKRNPTSNIGEIIRFPVADGYAQYMVAGLGPIELIHLPLGDAWSFQYAHLMTKKEILASISQEKAMAKLFS